MLESAEERAFLGIILQPVPADADSGGLAVMGVSPGSGAERAGLSVGDIVTRINDADLTIADEPMLALRTAMDAVSAGDVVTVGVMRDGGADGGHTAAFTWSDDTGLLVNEFDFDIRSLANVSTKSSGATAPHLQRPCVRPCISSMSEKHWVSTSGSQAVRW